MSVEDTANWVLINENVNGVTVKGPNWTVYSRAPNPSGPGVQEGEGFTAYAAWFNAFLHAGFTKYLAHDLALERLGVRTEVPSKPIL